MVNGFWFPMVNTKPMVYFATFNAAPSFSKRILVGLLSFYLAMQPATEVLPR